MTELDVQKELHMSRMRTQEMPRKLLRSSMVQMQMVTTVHMSSHHNTNNTQVNQFDLDPFQRAHPKVVEAETRAHHQVALLIA